uniref:F-box domain-containing protein n=1 Tax=Mycena chlorophos TaxID=658473 RepID=A0ABQ0LPD6_MYCCL|nr:predicted protein [Mycena chlorophos]
MRMNDPPLTLLPQIQRLVSTNEAPTSAGADAVKVLLEIHRTQSAVDGQHHQESNPTCSSIEKLNAVLAPIRRLPAEIIGEVLLAAFEDHRRQTRAASWAPWRLAHICRSWRNVALRVPRLWAKIVVFNGSCSSATLGRRQLALEEQLARSSCTPITLEISWSEPAGGLTTRHHDTRLVELVVAHCERWEHLQLDVLGDSDFFFSLLEPAQNRLLALHTLSCQGSGSISVGCDMFLDAPKLARVLYMVGEGYVRLPWAQLRSCYLGQSPRMGGLGSAHQLVVLELDLGYGERPGTNAVVTLPNLLHLRVWGGTGLQNLTAPLLRSLFIETVHHEIDRVPSFLRRSQCQLSALCIRQDWDLDEMFPTDVVIEILLCVPALALMLLIEREWITGKDGVPVIDEDDDDPTCIGDLFTFMQSGDSETSLAEVVPHLRTLVYHLRYSPFETDAFLGMASKRSTVEIFIPEVEPYLNAAAAAPNIGAISEADLEAFVDDNFPSPWS